MKKKIDWELFIPVIIGIALIEIVLILAITSMTATDNSIDASRALSEFLESEEANDLKLNKYQITWKWSKDQDGDWEYGYRINNYVYTYTIDDNGNVYERLFDVYDNCFVWES